MVKNRQSATSHLQPSPSIEAVDFANPQHPGLGLEVMTWAQFRRRVPEHHQRVHSRPGFHQLMLIEAGATDHDIDFARYRCVAGSVLHLRPGQVQQFVHDSGARGWVLLFRTEFLPQEAVLESWLAPLDASLVALRPAARASMWLALRALVAAYEGLGTASIGAEVDARDMRIRVLQHLLLALLLQLAQAHAEASAQARPQAPGSWRVYRRFLQSLESHFATSRDVADHANRVGCSTKTLARACVAVAGTGPKQMIERRVTLEAKRLLAHSTLSVAVIGGELGFSEPTNFVKFFRRCEGLTPAVFRERARLVQPA